MKTKSIYFGKVLKKLLKILQSMWEIIKKISQNLFKLLEFFSLIIALIALAISYESEKISKVALKMNSEEPVLKFNINYEENIIEIYHETSDIFTIKHVNYGLINSIVIYDLIESSTSTLQLEEKFQSANLEVNNIYSGGISEDKADQNNITIKLNLSDFNTSDWVVLENNEKFINKLDNRISQMCKSSLRCYYPDLNELYSYGYIQIYYIDAYYNKSVEYYVYQYTRFHTWELHKFSENEFDELTKDVNTIDSQSDEEIEILISKIFDKNNFIYGKNKAFVKDFYEPDYRKIKLKTE